MADYVKYNLTEMHLPAYFRQMFLALVEDLIKSLKLNISLPRLR